MAVPPANVQVISDVLRTIDYPFKAYYLFLNTAKGRCVQPGEGTFELRETQFAYNAIFDHENRDIDPK